MYKKTLVDYSQCSSFNLISLIKLRDVIELRYFLISSCFAVENYGTSYVLYSFAFQFVGSYSFVQPFLVGDEYIVCLYNTYRMFQNFYISVA